MTAAGLAVAIPAVLAYNACVRANRVVLAQLDRPQLTQRLAASAKLDPQPELHLRADKTTQYQALAEVMAAAGKAGLTRIGFVSDPREN